MLTISRNNAPAIHLGQHTLQPHLLSEGCGGERRGHYGGTPCHMREATTAKVYVVPPQNLFMTRECRLYFGCPMGLCPIATSL